MAGTSMQMGVGDLKMQISRWRHAWRYTWRIKCSYTKGESVNIHAVEEPLSTKPPNTGGWEGNVPPQLHASQY